MSQVSYAWTDIVLNIHSFCFMMLIDWRWHYHAPWSSHIIHMTDKNAGYRLKAVSFLTTNVQSKSIKRLWISVWLPSFAALVSMSQNLVSKFRIIWDHIFLPEIFTFNLIILLEIQTCFKFFSIVIRTLWVLLLLPWIFLLVVLAILLGILTPIFKDVIAYFEISIFYCFNNSSLLH